MNKLGSVSYSINYSVLNYILDLLENNYEGILNFIKLEPHAEKKFLILTRH